MTATAIKSFDLDPSAPSVALRESDAPRAWRAELGICVAAFCLLAAWVLIFPYTGDGDSVLHYLNARDGSASFFDVLHTWARPGYKVFLIWFAIHGIIPARLFMAGVSTITLWQTMRLAEDLKIRPGYLAGAMVLWQPMAFALAADTMTEIPMALCLVLAIRLWIAGRFTASCLLVGFLPTVRPEGFFFGVLWGVMVLVMPPCGPWWRRGLLLGALAVGMVTWVTACWWVGDPLLIYHAWEWPAKSYQGYGRGTIFHHFIGWPAYCGVPMTVLFVAGIRPSWRKEMWLPWTAWGVVFGVHTILYWQGWFASCGLMRIFACTSPLTALICLQGWNVLAERLEKRGWDQTRRRRAGFAFAGFATVWTVGQYCVMPEHFDCFPLLRCTAFIRGHHLLGKDTWFFTGNQIATADLGVLPHRPHVMEVPFDPAKIDRNLAALPIGAIGLWDNRQAVAWYGRTIEDLTGHGFTALYDTTLRFGFWKLRYVVLRKDGPFVANNSR